MRRHYTHYKTMLSKWMRIVVITSLIVSQFFLVSFKASAIQQIHHNILIVYPNKLLKVKAEMVSNYIGHFHVQKDTIQAQSLSSINLDPYSYVVILSNPIDSSFRAQMAQQLRGVPVKILWIGSMNNLPQQSVISVSYHGEEYPIKGFSVDLYNGVKPDHVYATASDGFKTYNLALKKSNNWYFLSQNIDNTIGMVFADFLHVFFGVTGDVVHWGYIRIEDVHPAVSPTKLKEIADVLYSHHIPFLVAVIPKFIDPKTHRFITMDDKPKFVEAIHYMVNHGGTVIMHGDTHQYRLSETGEGYEFWDSISDRPIVHQNTYIHKKILNGIAVLVKHGIYPVGFEPPHYAMSQLGYDIVHQYFSTLVGQIQLTDSTATSTQELPYRIHGWHGLDVLPETIGYVHTSQDTFQEMQKKIHTLMIVRDSWIAGFFHPFLPLSGLKELIRLMEQQPIQWVNLKYDQMQVHTPFITISTDNGSIKADVTDQLLLNQLAQENKQVKSRSIYVYIGWGLLGIIILFLILFLIYIIGLQHLKRDRLFSRMGDGR